MPIYRYQCQSCQQDSEYLQPVGATPPEQCCHCAKPQLKKIMAPIAHHSGGEITTVAERDIPQSAFAPLTPRLEGQWTRDRDGHKVRIG